MFIENIVLVVVFSCNFVFVSALGSAEVGRAKFPLLLLLLLSIPNCMSRRPSGEDDQHVGPLCACTLSG